MFFERDTLSFHLLDVLSANQKNVSNFNSGRNFSALSFRFHADAVMKTEKEECHLSDGSICFVPARLNYHRISKQDELIAIHFDMSGYSTQSIEHFTPADPEPFKRLFTQILHTWNERGTGYRYQCSAILYEILAECYRQNDVPASETSGISRSVDYIRKHYRDSTLSIRKIADCSFMSEVYFRKLFKTEYGISPQKYIIRLRIQNASALISSGYYSLKEVAYLSGYNDYKYFSVEFKKVMGVSPSAYSYNFSALIGKR